MEGDHLNQNELQETYDERVIVMLNVEVILRVETSKELVLNYRKVPVIKRLEASVSVWWNSLRSASASFLVDLLEDLRLGHKFNAIKIIAISMLYWLSEIL